MRLRLLLLALCAVAATVYFFDLGREPLNATEAYSYLAASQPTIGSAIAMAIRYDPGKPPLYHLLLHSFVAVFGTSEAAMRSLSAIFGLASIVLLFALGDELFGPEVGLGAAAIWAFSLPAVVLARWARMYAMFTAIALAHLLALRRLEQRPTAMRVVLFTLLGAALLYTHLGAVLVFGAEAAILVREWRRGRPTLAAWVGLALSCVLFAPFAPVALRQTHDLVAGHWLDWLGPARRQAPGLLPVAVIALLAGAGLWLVLGRALSFDCPGGLAGRNPEPLRWCLLWLFVPLAVLGAGSIGLRPVLQARYAAAVLPGLALTVAYGLDALGARVRNLGVTALAGSFLVGLFMYGYLVYRPSGIDPWRAVARTVASRGSPLEPVFFEAGYYMPRASAVGTNPKLLAGGFPQGYLRAPFDYYFAGRNPRSTINPYEPDEARRVLSQAALHYGGAWLITRRDEAEARAELPYAPALKVERLIGAPNASLYHIVPAAAPRINPSRN